MAQLGFVGLGAMGSRAAKRLMDAGHTVIGYNRTKSKAQWLRDAGMRWGETPRQVAGQADVVFSMVTDDPALQEIVEGPDGILAGLKSGKVFIDMSTVSPALSRVLARRVGEQGAQKLEAPVSGGPTNVEQGTAAMFVGGERRVFEQVKPILQAISSNVSYVGGHGQALVLKLAINLSLPVQFLSFSEGILLAEKNGIPRERAVELWLNSAVAAPAVKYRGPFVLKMSEQALFDVNMMQKDMRLALDLAKESDVPLPTGALVNEFLTAARGLGLGEQDFAALFQVLARLAGMETT